MVQKILTVEDLDVMIATEPKTESGHEESMKRVNDSLRELRNQRSRVKTLDDALDAYDGLVADAYKIRALGMDGQTSTCKAIGRAGTGNSQWNYPANFSWANWLIADHEGAQMQRNRTLESDYGTTLEQYKTLFQAHETSKALLRKELADRRLQTQMEQAQRTFKQDLESIQGDD